MLYSRGIAKLERSLQSRKVEIESTDYALREYGATAEELARFEKAAEQRYQKAKRAGTLVKKTPAELRTLIDQTSRH